LRIVLDSNVLVSGVLRAAGPPGRILDLVLGGRLQLLYDDRILAEYEEVLARPRFGTPRDALEDLLDALRASGEAVVAPPVRIRLRDPDDLPFLEVAAAASGAALVTGDRGLATAGRSLGLRCFSPNLLLAELHASADR
jgi:putative PIN family toxin of toxin-antitoxin system